MAIEWWICPAAPSLRHFDAPCGPEHCHVETRMDYFCRQICSDINDHIHAFIVNDQITNTVVTNDPRTITETIQFLLTRRRHSGIYFSPAILHTLPLPSQYARLNLDSSEKSKQDQLLGTVQLRVLVHHRRRRVRFLGLNSGFWTKNTTADCLTMEPSLDSSFGNWLSKVCNRPLCDCVTGERDWVSFTSVLG